MAFKTKLQLSNRKFEQLSGQTLSLSGDTILTGKITINPRDGIVDGLDAVNKAYVDGVVGGFSANYTGASPSNIEVGGLEVGSTLTGRTLSEILENILITTFTPILNPPNNSFNITGQASTQEVGVTTNINFDAEFNQGSIVLQGTTQNPRSGGATEFNYAGTDLPATVTTLDNSDDQTIANYTILQGSNSWSSSVDYDAGPQPLDSDGNDFSTPLPAGTTSTKTATITGIYPYFYGVVDVAGTTPTRPSSNQALINSGTKVVAGSSGTITIPYQNISSSNSFLWFAIPEGSTSKSEWFITELNRGDIGGTTNLFPNPDIVSIDSPTTLWAGQNYKIYVSLYRTDVPGAMQLRN